MAKVENEVPQHLRRLLRERLEAILMEKGSEGKVVRLSELLSSAPAELLPELLGRLDPRGLNGSGSIRLEAGTGECG